MLPALPTQDADSASTSPSPSTSVAKTEMTADAAAVMTRSDEKVTLVQAIVGRGVGAGLSVGAGVVGAGVVGVAVGAVHLENF